MSGGGSSSKTSYKRPDPFGGGGGCNFIDSWARDSKLERKYNDEKKKSSKKKKRQDVVDEGEDEHGFDIVSARDDDEEEERVAGGGKHHESSSEEEESDGDESVVSASVLSADLDRKVRKDRKKKKDHDLGSEMSNSDLDGVVQMLKATHTGAGLKGVAKGGRVSEDEEDEDDDSDSDSDSDSGSGSSSDDDDDKKSNRKRNIVTELVSDAEKAAKLFQSLVTGRETVSYKMSHRPIKVHLRFQGDLKKLYGGQAVGLTRVIPGTVLQEQLEKLLQQSHYDTWNTTKHPNIHMDRCVIAEVGFNKFSSTNLVQPWGIKLQHPTLSALNQTVYINEKTGKSEEFLMINTQPAIRDVETHQEPNKLSTIELMTHSEKFGAPYIDPDDIIKEGLIPNYKAKAGIKSTMTYPVKRKTRLYNIIMGLSKKTRRDRVMKLGKGNLLTDETIMQEVRRRLNNVYKGKYPPMRSLIESGIVVELKPLDADGGVGESASGWRHDGRHSHLNTDERAHASNNTAFVLDVHLVFGIGVAYIEHSNNEDDEFEFVVDKDE